MLAHNSQSCQLINTLSRVDAILRRKLFLVFCQTRHLRGTRDINNKMEVLVFLTVKTANIILIEKPLMTL